MKETTILTRFRLMIGLVLLTGCDVVGQTNTPKRASTNEVEASFFANPGCPTTYALVGDKKQAAVPLILEALDRLCGESNAGRRCEIIQGALYRRGSCTNIYFLPIIQRGTNDPSASVRAKTTNMVERAIRNLREAEQRAAPPPRDPQPGHSEGER